MSEQSAAEAMREAAVKAVEAYESQRRIGGAAHIPQPNLSAAIRALPLPAAPSEPTGEGQVVYPAICLPLVLDLATARDDLARMTAERDALKRDIAMVSHSLKLAYDIREALGWNKYTGLSLMPDEVRRRTSDLARMKAALEWYANPEIYKPHPHGPAFDDRDLSYHAIAALKGPTP